MEKDEMKLIEAIDNKAFKDGEKIKLKCAAALHIAAEYNVKPSHIGAICNERNIRISRCQLGCFD